MFWKKFVIGTIVIFLTISISYLLFLEIETSDNSITQNAENVKEVVGNQIVIAFRNDDISAFSDAIHEGKMIALFEKYNFSQTFGIIPMVAEDIHSTSNIHYRSLKSNPKVVALLKEKLKEGKIEIALHGYTHQTNRFHPNNWWGYGEFRYLPYDEQADKIRKGKSLLEELFDSEVVIFAPPWNAFDQNTIRACSNAGLKTFSGIDYCSPCKGVSFVNTNVDSLNRFQETLYRAKQRKRPRFIIMQYHSGSINDSEEFKSLEGALSTIAKDPSVSVLTIGEMAEYERELLSLNSAGYSLQKAAKTKKALHIYGKIARKIGIDRSDNLYSQAESDFGKGNYKKVSLLAPQIFWEQRKGIIFGRALSIGISVISIILFWILVKLKWIAVRLRSIILVSMAVAFPLLIIETFPLFLHFKDAYIEHSFVVKLFWESLIRLYLFIGTITLGFILTVVAYNRKIGS